MSTRTPAFTNTTGPHPASPMTPFTVKGISMGLRVEPGPPRPGQVKGVSQLRFEALLGQMQQQDRDGDVAGAAETEKEMRAVVEKAMEEFPGRTGDAGKGSEEREASSRVELTKGQKMAKYDALEKKDPNAAFEYAVSDIYAALEYRSDTRDKVQELRALRKLERSYRLAKKKERGEARVRQFKHRMAVLGAGNAMESYQKSEMWEEWYVSVFGLPVELVESVGEGEVVLEFE